MRANIKKVICALMSLCVVLLCGCVVSWDYLSKKEQGLYPDTADFPNTKWICREIDMCLYMFGYEEEYMIGTYEVDDGSYRVVATFESSTFNFEIYSSTQISISEYSDSMVRCDPISCGFIYTSYMYDKDTDTIVCSISNYDPVLNELIPETLTFDKVGSILQNASARWYAQEIDMYLDSFSDVDGYFRGEIAIGGERHYVHALEIGNNGYFMLSIENGKTNNLLSGTTSLLIYMHFEITDNQIIAKVSDDFFTNAVNFPYWPYDTIITFKPLSS